MKAEQHRLVSMSGPGLRHEITPVHSSGRLSSTPKRTRRQREKSCDRFTRED